MIYLYNALVATTHILFDIGDILCSSFISWFHVSLKGLSYCLNWNLFFLRSSYSIWSFVTLKSKLVASERKWWLCLIRFLKLSHMTVCSYHVTYAFQSELTLYSCLNVKERLARSRREIWSLVTATGLEPRTT